MNSTSKAGKYLLKIVPDRQYEQQKELLKDRFDQIAEKLVMIFEYTKFDKIVDLVQINDAYS